MRKILLIVVVLIVAAVVYFSMETSVTGNLDSYVYGLPYAKGESYKVVQGYGGMFSHQHKAALDFSMPEGTPVYAARGGVIYSTKDNSNEGGPFSKYENKANYIIIQHNDGSFGCYWHLKKNGVIIKKGRVKQGEMIGYSGATGFVLRPHLHFTVKAKLNYEEDSFIRTKFRTGNGVELLEKGKYYERPL